MDLLHFHVLFGEKKVLNIKQRGNAVTKHQSKVYILYYLGIRSAFRLISSVGSQHIHTDAVDRSVFNL